MAHADILFYALVAVVLLLRLWAVLGRRNDEDIQRPNPYVTPAPGSQDDVPFNATRSRADDPVQMGSLLIAPMSLLGALENIKQLDPSFDEKQFLQTARNSFTTVVNDFAKGDLSTARPLLGPSVSASFEAAIAARNKSGETLETRIARIIDAETAAAKTEDGRALITVRFTSEQENILRDATGTVLNGIPGKTEEITDLWVFARDPKSPDTNWLIVETKS